MLQGEKELQKTGKTCEAVLEGKLQKVFGSNSSKYRRGEIKNYARTSDTSHDCKKIGITNLSQSRLRV